MNNAANDYQKWVAEQFSNNEASSLPETKTKTETANKKFFVDHNSLSSCT